MIYINTRSLAHRTTGVQRYITEISRRFRGEWEAITPLKNYSGAEGHLWEQVVLPIKSRGALLFSPGNTGPIIKYRQVVTIHDLATVDHPEWFEKKFAAWYAAILNRLVRRCIHIITISEFTKERILAIAPSVGDKVTVIRNGVDHRFSACGRSEIADTIATLQLPSDRYVLALGSIEPRKNIVNLLKAWSLICKDIPNDIWLVVVGQKGPSQIFSAVDLDYHLDRVYFTGYIADEYLPSLYSGALVFSYPSLYEGFGLPPLEAMACGTPVISSVGTAMEEMLGDAAVLVDPLDPKEIALSLDYLLRNSSVRDRLRKRSIAHARNFSWTESAMATEELLKAL